MKRIALLLAVALFAASCGESAPTNKLEIISPHPEIIQEEFGPAFEAYYREKTGTDIKVVWRDMGGTSDALRWITGEFEKRPEGIDLDLFYGGGIDPYERLRELGHLEAYIPADEIISGIPKEFAGVPLYAEDHTWHGAAISGFGIIYNKQLIKQLGVEAPKTWKDLADPRLFTWVGAGDPRHSGTVHMMYEIMLQAYGWEEGWRVITAIGGNTRNFVQNSGDIPREVSAGRIAAGTSIDFYAWTQVSQAGSDVVGFVMPEGLTVINPDSMGILKGAPNMEAAKMFVDFTLSDAGQKLWYLKAGSPGGPARHDLLRMPVRPALYEEYGDISPVKMNPFEWTKGFLYDPSVGTARWSALNDLLGSTVVDNHTDLIAAWKKAVEAKTTAEALPALSTPPVTAEELVALAGSDLKDAVKRTDITGKWVTYAREKYKSSQ